MNKYFEAIEKGKQHSALFETFGYTNVQSDNLEKSHIENMFEHDAPQRGFTIDKKGSDIKERLKKLLTEEQGVETMLRIKWTEILPKLDKQPTVPAIKARYYLVDGWEDKLGDLPLMFEWEDIDCAPVAESKSDCYVESTPSAEAECKKLRREYNDLVDKYIGCKREIALLNTMIDGFSDTKTYKLTVREATMLGW